MSSVAIPGTSFLSRMTRWLDAMPHPALACEISATHVAAVRSAHGRLATDGFAVETLPAGAVAPSPVELNIVDAGAVRERLQRALGKIGASGPEAALLVPDQVVRIFLLHFETFPRRADEATPLLRWRLKKSVPFDVEDTVVTYMLQPAAPSAGAGVDVLAAVARQTVIRQYEELMQAAGLTPGVVLSSTLATVSFLEDPRPALLARLCDRTLTTLIVRGESLCVYRCTEMPADADTLEPKALLDEIYPAVAFFQDTWRENIAQVRLAGLGGRFEAFRRPVEAELGASVTSLSASAVLEDRFSGAAKETVDRHLDALVGWMLHRGA